MSEARARSSPLRNPFGGGGQSQASGFATSDGAPSVGFFDSQWSEQPGLGAPSLASAPVSSAPSVVGSSTAPRSVSPIPGAPNMGGHRGPPSAGPPPQPMMSNPWGGAGPPMPPGGGSDQSAGVGMVGMGCMGETGGDGPWGGGGGGHPNGGGVGPPGRPEGAGGMGVVPPPHQGGQGAQPWGGFNPGDPMQQAAIAMGSQLVGANMEQAQKQMSAGFSVYLVTVRRYFNVSHESVLRKLGNMLVPFLSSVKKDPHSFTGDFGDVEKPAVPGHLMPDLYIPLMGYITFILMCGLARGAVGEFHPEVLGTSASFALGMVLLEVVVVRGGYFVLGASGVATLEILATAGSKFVHLCLVILIGLTMAGTWLYWLAFLILAGAAAFNALQQLGGLHVRRAATDAGWSPSNHSPAAQLRLFALIVAAAQVPLCWLLTPSFVAKSAVAAAKLLQARAKQGLGDLGAEGGPI